MSLPVQFLPAPKHFVSREGRLPVPLAPALSPGPGVLRELLPRATVTIDPEAPVAAGLPADGKAEAYHVVVSPEAATVTAVTPEGLLRAGATLLQMLQSDGSGLWLPCCEITDWPDFRYRCASDWLLNVECNRWGYDFGDGPEAYLARIKRKLDMCYRHKINQVWFDGFGWDVNRTPHYADLMRECSRYARERGIKLTFAGYGGGYGTSYQKSELYRCGYQGEVFYNRRPYPDGEIYDCCGCDGHAGESRKYGTCPSNEGLKAAKLAEMRRFVTAIEPGFMYLHDVDTGTWEASQQSWLWRCDECRRRWPSDEMIDPQGQAGAFAGWFGLIRDTMSQVATDAYNAAEDLTLIFTSPLYTSYYEQGQPELWEMEVEYFRLLSELIGPRANVQFGFREQFYRADGSKKIAHLRQALDDVGHGHGPHVIAFGGGDNYTSNDLCNVSGALSYLYEGAASVCLSNGGVHEEPLQLLNAEFLWNGVGKRYGLDPPDEPAVRALWDELCLGHRRPDQVFGEQGLLRQACEALWGEQAGRAMWQAYLTGGESGHGPISRVWWAITREVRRLLGDLAGPAWTWPQMAEVWRQKAQATAEALEHARQAAWVTRDEDVHWFARCLEVGLRFATALQTIYEQGQAAGRVTDTEGVVGNQLADLREHIAGNFTLQPTDLLGGDPGCWLQTVDALQALLSEEG